MAEIKAILFIAGIPIATFLLRRWMLTMKVQLNPLLIKGILLIHFLALGLFLLSLILQEYHYSFRGKNSTSILFIVTVFSAVVLYILEKFRSRIKLFYFALITWGLTSAAIFWLMAFMHNPDSVYYQDNSVRLERSIDGGMECANLPDLFVYHGLLEKRYHLSGDYVRKDEVDSIRVHQTNHSFIITFYCKGDTTRFSKKPQVIVINK